MPSYHITYRMARNAVAQACVIEATDFDAALIKLGPHHSLVRASQQCEGTTASGNPCRTLTVRQFCRHHEPKGAR